MVHKNKNTTIQNITATVNATAAHLGVTAMVLATVAAVGETSIHEGQKMAAVLLPHVAYTQANHNIELQPGHELRRAGGTKEEVHQHSGSFSMMRRSHSVTGAL